MMKYMTRKSFKDGTFKGRNQFGEFEAKAPVGSQKLPGTPELEKQAQRIYGKSFDDLSRQERTELKTGRKKLSTDTKTTYEQFKADYKAMSADPNYEPKFVKPMKGAGMSAQQMRARKDAAEEVGESFIVGLNRNVARRKKAKAKAKREADPELREKYLAGRAERRSRRRTAKMDDIGLSEKEKDLNFRQRLYQKQLNEKVRANPDIILKDEDIMKRISTTVDKNGNIVVTKPGVTKKTLQERGIFEIEHQRDIYKKGKMKDFPYNRNLIMGPHNRSGGFKEMAERYIESNPNPNDPKVKNILRKADELKITIQPNIAPGIFPTKGLGYKQDSDPVRKFKTVAKSIAPSIEQGTVLKSEAVPGSRYVGEFMSNMVDDLVKRRYGTFLLKGTGAGLVGYGIYDMGVGFAEGRSAPELAARAFGLDPIYRTAKEFYRLSPEAQEIQKQVNQQRSFDAAMEDPLDEALVTMRPRPEVSKQDLIKLEQEKEVAKEQIRQEDAQRSRSRMGLVDQAKQFFMERTGQPFVVELKEGGPVDKGRRKFLKVSLTGLAAIPFIGPKLFKPAAKVVPEVVDVVTRSADSIPTYLNDLIGKVKMMGNSKLLGKPDSPDGFVEYELGDITVTEGNNFTRVRKRNERGEFLDSEVEMEIKQDPETNALEYEEVTASPDAEGKLKDVDFGIDDNVHEDLKKFTYED